MPETPDATVVIVTFNRKDELRNAVASALQQTAQVEVLVLDDGSTDGTEAMIRDEFPTVRYDRGSTNVGYIVHRNRAADLAHAPVLVSIDDDAVFSTPHTVQQTLDDFDDPRIGAVAIPYIDVLKDDRLQTAAPEPQGRWATSMFRGTSYAVRKDVFNQVGRFRESLRHMGEEYDFCLRMLGAGYAVRLGRADPIHHFESPKRVRAFILEQNTRNWIISAFMNYPLARLPLQLVAHTFHALRMGFRRRMPLVPVRGLVRGYSYALGHLRERQPVAGDRFRAFRKLWSSGPVPLEELLPSGTSHADPPRRNPVDQPTAARE